MVALAREKCPGDDFSLQGKVYAFDSSTIDLCLNVFWWAGFRKAKGGIKLHTLLDVNCQIPVFVHITEALVHDVNAMEQIQYEDGAYYIFDRGYLDYTRLYVIQKHAAFFVIRAKSNTKFRRMYSNKADKASGVIYDQTGKLTGFYVSKSYPEKLRRVKYYDADTNRTFLFLTNNLELKATEIAMLYKNRWKIELFFKWIKQHLKIKSFWGTTENAVRIQIFSAITTYCLVAIIDQELKIHRSTYEILQVIGISLLDKAPINEILKITDSNNVKERMVKQLSLNLF